MINIGINGFGRIGKLLARLVVENPQMRLANINHPSMTKADFHNILKYDSVHGQFNIPSSAKIHNQYEPTDIEWDNEIDIVIDTTGKFKTHDELIKHKDNTDLDDSAIIILSAPPQDETPMFVYGVNHVDYNYQDVISAASCTTTCLAPIVDVLNKNYTINNGLATTIHSATASQYTVDKYTPGKRTGRTLLNNIIPSSTGAAKAIGKVIPALNGKLNAVSVRVPVSNISLVDLCVNLDKQPDVEEINELFRKLSEKEYYDIVDVSDDLLVSSDFLGNSSNAILDAPSTMKQDNLYKLLIWYDNELGYAHNIIRLVKYLKL